MMGIASPSVACGCRRPVIACAEILLMADVERLTGPVCGILENARRRGTDRIGRTVSRATHGRLLDPTKLALRAHDSRAAAGASTRLHLAARERGRKESWGDIICGSG